MKTRPEHDELWSDLLSENAPVDFRRASLERTLAAARGHQRRRRICRAAAMAVLPCVFFLAVFLWREGDTAIRRVASGGPAAAPPQAARAVPGTRIHLITDAELFAMFPDRPAALIGSDKDRQFVLLDELPKPAPRPDPAAARQRL